MLKAAKVELLEAMPISPGKFLVIFAGGVAEVEASLEAGRRAAGDSLVDELRLATVHPDVPAAIARPRGERPMRAALGIVETTTVAAAIVGADAARKRRHSSPGIAPGRGIGGKDSFTLTGDVASVQAGADAARVIIDRRVAQCAPKSWPPPSLDSRAGRAHVEGPFERIAARRRLHEIRARHRNGRGDGEGWGYARRDPAHRAPRTKGTPERRADRRCRSDGEHSQGDRVFFVRSEEAAKALPGKFAPVDAAIVGSSMDRPSRERAVNLARVIGAYGPRRRIPHSWDAAFFWRPIGSIPAPMAKPTGDRQRGRRRRLAGFDRRRSRISGTGVWAWTISPIRSVIVGSSMRSHRRGATLKALTRSSRNIVRVCRGFGCARIRGRPRWNFGRGSPNGSPHHSGGCVKETSARTISFFWIAEGIARGPREAVHVDGMHM